MDSTRDLRDALDEADPRTHQAARASRAQIPNKAVVLPSRLLPGGAACSLCHSPPAPGSKLKHCGRCRVHSYCNSTCAKAHWPKHRLACERMVRNREEQEVARAAYDKTHGGRVSHLSDRGAQEWFAAVPGLSNQVALLAWQHRSESPIIHVFANRSDVTGRVLKIRMEPRSCWEGKAGYSELQQQFDDSSFRPNEQYMVQMELVQENQSMTSTTIRFFRDHVVRGAEIVEALTTATRAEDLDNACAWIEDNLDGGDIRETLRHRAATLLGDIAVASCGIPAPSRALNNEVAYVIIIGLKLQFAVRLTGLVGASHLNGSEGVIYDQVCGNVRWKVRLGDGACVEAKAENFVHVRGSYKRKLP